MLPNDAFSNKWSFAICTHFEPSFCKKDIIKMKLDSFPLRVQGLTQLSESLTNIWYTYVKMHCFRGLSNFSDRLFLYNCVWQKKSVAIIFYLSFLPLCITKKCIRVHKMGFFFVAYCSLTVCQKKVWILKMLNFSCWKLTFFSFAEFFKILNKNAWLSLEQV